MAIKFNKGGQTGWYHDGDIPGGYFHTYDALSIVDDCHAHKVHIFLPQDYEDSDQQFPTLYMQDGALGFWNNGYATWDVANTVLNEEVQRPIVIAIEPFDRDYEYTHVQWNEDKPHGGLFAYSNWVATVLKPWVDDTYRTLPEPKYTGVVGASHGGLASFYIANMYPDVFGIAGCLSSSFWVGLDPAFLVGYGDMTDSDLVQQLKHTFSSEVRPRVWIDWGMKRDGGEHNEHVETSAMIASQALVSLLETEYGYTKDVDLFYMQDELGGHDEQAWSYRFQLFVKTFYPK
eukprot:TRINITY_DN3775_c0_g1_i1.p1 TRINITY_DN3775_c0_g1~~TRINITY_DN3775_c0_g1_i1.p1  ORF type:complete len:297 (-),score=64.61 TRINITY_DN3775_c0_g1_i1:48-914(-)